MPALAWPRTCWSRTRKPLIGGFGLTCSGSRLSPKPSGPSLTKAVGDSEGLAELMVFYCAVHKGRGSAISKELAEELGVFDSATGLRRKSDGSLEVLWSADTPKDQKTIQRHIQVEEVDSKIVLIQQDGQRLTFADPQAARQHLSEQLGDFTLRKNGGGLIASRAQ